MPQPSTNVEAILKRLRSSCIDPQYNPSDLLRQVRVLALDLGQPDLDQWARRELDGYDGVDASEVPRYRHVGIAARGHFSGPFGSALNNAPIHLGAFPSSKRDELQRVLTTAILKGPIAEYEAMMSGSDKSIQFDLSRLAAILGTNVYEDMNCLDVHGVCTKASLTKVTEGVKNSILTLTLELAARFPVTDSDYLMTHHDPISQVINTIINGGNANVAVASENFSQTSNISNELGSVEALRDVLLANEVPEDATADLLAAVQAETPTSEGYGPKVSGAISRALGFAADGTWKVSLAVAAKLIADAIGHYYGH